MSGESFSHVLVTVVLFIDQMVGCRNVVVTVSFHTSDSVLLLELIVFDQFLEEDLLPGHLLEAWEETWLTGNRINTDKVGLHKSVGADVLNSQSFFGVGVQNLCYEIFALRRQEFWHLVVSTHDFLV